MKYVYTIDVHTNNCRNQLDSMIKESGTGGQGTHLSKK